MNILAIDAATSILSLTLRKGEEYFQYNADRGFRHSELIMPGVDRLFKETDTEPADLDLVCTALGPGSFTGLRVGMATAKGICAGTGAPFVAVPTLDVLARPFALFAGLTVPLIDARKKRFFSALYRRGERLTSYADIDPEDLFTLIEKYRGKDEAVLITGPDCFLMKEAAENRPDSGTFLFDGECRRGNGLSLLSLGRELYVKRGADPMDTGPLYMRKSEAEISLEARQSSRDKN